MSVVLMVIQGELSASTPVSAVHVPLPPGSLMGEGVQMLRVLALAVPHGALGQVHVQVLQDVVMLMLVPAMHELAEQLHLLPPLPRLL